MNRIIFTQFNNQYCLFWNYSFRFPPLYWKIEIPLPSLLDKLLTSPNIPLAILVESQCFDICLATAAGNDGIPEMSFIEDRNCSKFDSVGIMKPFSPNRSRIQYPISAIVSKGMSRQSKVES